MDKKKEETKEILTPSQQYHLALHAMPSTIGFNAIVSYGKTKFEYVDFKALRTAVLPVLDKYDLSVRYSTTITAEGSVLLLGEIAHKDGEVVNSFGLPLRHASKPQDLGSEITYYKRYALAALCGVVSDKDDDGNFADKAEAEREAQEKAKKPKGSHKMDQNMRPALSAIFATTSLEEFEQCKVDFKEPFTVIYKEWPAYMNEVSGEQTKSFTVQIEEHKHSLQNKEDLQKLQEQDMEPPL